MKMKRTFKDIFWVRDFWLKKTNDIKYVWLFFIILNVHNPRRAAQVVRLKNQEALVCTAVHVLCVPQLEEQEWKRCSSFPFVPIPDFLWFKFFFIAALFS